MRAFIFAAGRGERMRPLTDTTPKPLLEVWGKPLIVWHIERLAQAGFREIVINHAWLGARIEAALGDGSRWGVRILWSREPEALETAGGVAFARHLLGEAPFLAVSADIVSDFDYRKLHAQLAVMTHNPAGPDVHLVMVPNPPFHPQGDFGLTETGQIVQLGGQRLTYGNFCLMRPSLFQNVRVGEKMALRPLWDAAIEAGRVRGELYEGTWENVGTPAQLAALNASKSEM